MRDDFRKQKSGDSRTKQTFLGLRKKLGTILLVAENEITLSGRLEALIPPKNRQQVWQDLGESGMELPALTLSSRVFYTAAMVALAPVALLVAFFHWTFVFSLAELALLARKATRPLAIHPPIGCQTVREAVLHLTPFQHQDYRAGLWPREDIAAKVRLIIASAWGIPFEEVTDKTRIGV